MASKAIVKVPPPERKLKQQNARKVAHKSRVQRVKHQLKKKEDKEKEMVKRYYKYRRHFKAQIKKVKNLRKVAKAVGNYYVDAEPKIAFVIRIRGVNDMPPKARKILQLLRLRQIFNGVFVRLNKATLNMLRLVSPWITWGTPSMVTIRKLLYKRAHLKYRHQRKKISNDLIEKALHKYNIICIEDLIFQLASCGPRFKEVTRLLWPFKLRSPAGGMRSKRRHFIEGGDNGNREYMINRLIQKML